MGSADRYPSLPNGLRVAPAWRQLVAGLINLTAGIVPLAGAGFGGYKLRRFLGPPLRPLTRRLEAWGKAHDFESGVGKLSPRTRILIEVVGLTLELDSRNRRSLGARAMRIRGADALTGGPVTIRSALIRNWAQRATSAGLRPLAKRASKRSTERMQALQPQLKELQRAHADDKAAQQQALMRFYQEHKINPFRSCAPTLLTVVAPSLAVLFSPRRQSLPDRLAGIVWVKADPGKAGWSLARRGRRSRA
jgi:uncharacterized RDD family membrane protein YckC